MRSEGVTRYALWLLACFVGCGDNPYVERMLEKMGPLEGPTTYQLPNPLVLTRAGDSVPLHATFGDRWTVLNIGGTWCAFCRLEMSELQSLHEAWSDQDTRVVWVALDSPEDQVEEWVRRFGLTLPIVHGPSGDEWGRFGSAWLKGVPRTFLVDSAGVARFFVRGFRESAPLEPLLAPFLSGELSPPEGP